MFSFDNPEYDKWKKIELEHNIYYPFYEKARNLERAGFINEALDIYLNILKEFSPIETAYYERPAILLEKLKRYSEAIVICERAITKIDNIYFHANPDEFQHRINRLKKKLLKCNI